MRLLEANYAALLLAARRRRLLASCNTLASQDKPRQKCCCNALLPALWLSYIVIYDTSHGRVVSGISIAGTVFIWLSWDCHSHCCLLAIVEIDGTDGRAFARS